MKFYISATGIRRLTISAAAAGGGGGKVPAAAGRRIWRRTVLPVAVVLGIVLPFLFLRTAFLVLEVESSSSSLDCIGWRFFSGSDTSLKMTLWWKLESSWWHFRPDEMRDGSWISAILGSVGTTHPLFFFSDKWLVVLQYYYPSPLDHILSTHLIRKIYKFLKETIAIIGGVLLLFPQLFDSFHSILSKIK